jgi:hypothetical protein
MANVAEEYHLYQPPHIRLRWMANYVNMTYIIAWMWATSHWPTYGFAILGLWLCSWLVAYAMNKISRYVNELTHTT